MKIVEFMKEVCLLTAAPVKLEELFFPTVPTGAGGS